MKLPIDSRQHSGERLTSSLLKVEEGPFCGHILLLVVELAHALCNELVIGRHKGTKDQTFLLECRSMPDIQLVSELL